MERPAYRPDIDGLRAIAVLSVVAYHADERLLPGGFTGVDIFFVISGYLISGIVLGDLREGRWSYRRFYERRFRRLFPALATMFVAVLSLGWFALLADELALLGKHIAAAALFSANLLNWSEAGYFDAEAARKPLLHLWSLAVEEQFYLVWPVVLVLLRRRLALVGHVAVALWLFSFVHNVARIDTHAVSAFFLLPSRMWELLTGALLAARSTVGGAAPAAPGPVHEATAIAGSVLLVAGFAMIDGNSAFPGWWALLPVLGTAGVVGAGPDTAVSRMLSTRALVAIGLVSYPLYLWHWPLLSFARIVEDGNPANSWIVAAVAISFVLAWATYRWIEKPLRFGTGGSEKAAALVTAIFALGVAGLTLWLRDGAPWRPAAANTVAFTDWELAKGRWRNGCPLPHELRRIGVVCGTDLRGRPRYAVLGDSHARAIFPGLLEATRHDETWTIVSRVGFLPLRGIDWAPNEKENTTAYPALRDATLESVKADPSLSVVMLAFSTRVLRYRAHYELPASTSLDDWMETALSTTIRELESAGKRVVFLVDNPAITLNPQACARKRPFQSLAASAVCSIPREAYETRIAWYRALITRLQQRYPELLVYDPTELLCGSGDCSVMKDGAPLYAFTDHYSDYGSRIVAEGLMQFLRARLQDDRAKP
jgi:peptidoglycan/LPS O-acetylase OafA/YrhL